MTGEVQNSEQYNYLSLNSTMTRTDEVFTCFVNVTGTMTKNRVDWFAIILDVYCKCVDK